MHRVTSVNSARYIKFKFKGQYSIKFIAHRKEIIEVSLVKLLKEFYEINFLRRDSLMAGERLFQIIGPACQLHIYKECFWTQNLHVHCRSTCKCNGKFKWVMSSVDQRKCEVGLINWKSKLKKYRLYCSLFCSRI